MHFTTIFTSTLLLFGSALAQSQDHPSGTSDGTTETTSTSASEKSTSEAAATPTNTAGIKVHVVKVSDVNAGLFFSPNNIQAAKGDMVQFQFFPRVSRDSISHPA